MRVLVTGGAGFIGSSLVRELLATGHDVRVLDNLATGRPENLSEVKEHLEFLSGDIRDTGILDRACRGVEVVFHQAALGSVDRSVNDPRTTHDVNATGTLNVLMAARDAGARKVVYASSSSIYGLNPELPKHEGLVPQPASPYAVSKLTGEQYCLVFASLYGISTVALRYFNVFGPRQDPHSAYAAVIPRFITAVLRGERPLIFGDGRQTRDFTFIDNVVQANLLAARSEVSGRFFNIAANQRTSLLELLEMIGAVAGRRPEPVFKETRAGDVRDSLASIDKARECLGYTPSVNLKQGLEKTHAWLKGATGSLSD